jgi:hypothetical protein
MGKMRRFESGFARCEIRTAGAGKIKIPVLKWFTENQHRKEQPD